MILRDISHKKISALSGEFFIEIYTELFKIQLSPKFPYTDIHVLAINKSIIVFRFPHAESIAQRISRKAQEKMKLIPDSQRATSAS